MEGWAGFLPAQDTSPATSLHVELGTVDFRLWTIYDPDHSPGRKQASIVLIGSGVRPTFYDRGQADDDLLFLARTVSEVHHKQTPTLRSCGTMPH